MNSETPSPIPETPTLSLTSTMGMIVVYDPTLLKDRVKTPSTWWSGAPLATAERREGRYAAWPLTEGKTTRRPYRVRLAGELSETEAPYVVGRSEPAPLQVNDEDLFLGPIERLPGDGGGDRISAIPEQGQLVNMTPGKYSLEACILDWQREESFFNEDNEPTADAPPDVVILLTPVDELPVPAEDPAPLLSLIPTKTPLASKEVRFHTRPRSPDPEPVKKKRRSTPTKRRIRGAQPVAVKALRPGELGVGARVRHPTYGVGTVLFVKEGFPKAKVSFVSSQIKVDKDELTVLS